jgi:hypothetical protein
MGSKKQNCEGVGFFTKIFTMRIEKNVQFQGNILQSDGKFSWTFDEKTQPIDSI